MNPGLINLDHSLVDLSQEDPVIDSSMQQLVRECRQLIDDPQKETFEVQEPLAIVTTIGMDSPAIGQHIGSSSAVKDKPPPKLGIMQRDIKKGGAERLVKSGHKKDVEKIKLASKNLVESGAVKPLDSIFSCPSK